MSGDRRKRLLKILELISSRPLRTQEEVADALAAEGWPVTQSSVSRDIAALKLVKVEGAYQRPSRIATTPEHPDERRLVEGVLTVDLAGDAMIVLHTPTGEATRVALALDRLAWPEIIGTIAGDDTIFLAVKNGAAQQRVVRQIKKLSAAR